MNPSNQNSNLNAMRFCINCGKEMDKSSTNQSASRRELPSLRKDKIVCVFRFPVPERDELIKYGDSGAMLQLRNPEAVPLFGTIRKILIADSELKKQSLIEVLIGNKLIASIPADREILDAMPPLKFEGYALSIRGDSPRNRICAMLVLELEIEGY